jgi:SAM-dependent methyltransferase
MTAANLAGELGFSDRSEFVAADVYDAPTVLDGRRFDVVYTGSGALCWLPDIHRWARTVANLLRPGGWLHLAEFHPLTDVLDDE